MRSISKALHLALSIFTLAFIISSSTSSTRQLFVLAWWNEGHMIAANIAQLNLDQFTIDVVNAHFAYLAKIGPWPQVPDMINGAIFPDEIKQFGVTMMDPWHFVQKPYDPSNFDYPTKGCPIQQDNAENMIPKLIAAAKTPANENLRPWVTSFAFAFLGHILPDSHQPLHSIDQYSETFPDGDLGGNLVRTSWSGPGGQYMTELHAFWDSVCSSFWEEYPIPYNKSFLEQHITTRAKKINSTYFVSWEEGHILDPVAIVNESYDLAISVAYAGLDNNIVNVLNETYHAKCLVTAERQLLRAGMRLSFVLKDIVDTLYPVGAANRTVPDFVSKFLKNNQADDGCQQNWNGGKTFGVLFGGVLLGALSVFAWNHISAKQHKTGEKHPYEPVNNTAANNNNSVVGDWKNVNHAGGYGSSDLQEKV